MCFKQILLQEITILKRQQELFSDSVVTSPELASAVFGNNETSRPKDLEYYITNNIILFIGDAPHYFNIDTVNYDNKKFYISEMNIRNQSKDAFTAKSGYRITLKIHFTEFDDLLEKNIRVSNLLNPEYVEYIAPLQLLYKFFDFNTNQFGKSLSDGHGIYISQALKYLDNTKVKNQLFNDINDIELVKNYHVNYFTHRFEMFKNEEPIFKYFENELVIEYAAYEVDGEEKPISRDIEKYLPKTSGNLYNILNDERYLKADTKFNKIYAESIRNLQDTKNILNIFNEQLIKNNNALKCKDKAVLTDDDRVEIIKSNEEMKEKIVSLKNFSNFMLLNYILDDLFIYKIDFPRDLLGIYEVGNFKEALWENLSLSGILSSTAVAAPEAIATAATAGAAAASIAATGGIAVGIYGAYALIAAAMSTKIETTNVSVDMIRESFESFANSFQPLQTIEDKTSLKGTWSERLSGKENYEAFRMSKAGTFFDKSNEEAKKARDKAQQEADGSVELLPADAYQKSAPILFTTFGDILELISKINTFKDSVNYIIGGYVFDVDVSTKKSKYVNFYNIPITLSSAVKFLQSQIVDTDKNFKYDTDVFFRDCYDNLIKNILKDGDIILQSIKKTTPKTLKIASTIHKKPPNAKPEWLKDLNLLSDDEYKKFKLEFLKTKNLNFSKGLGNERLYKIYFIGSEEEYKYYDFYDNYATWASSKDKGNKRFMYNVLEFQEYINTEHLIPCLLMKNVSDGESILKKKYVNFQRLDNVNMETGNLQNGSGVLRKPYQFSADFKINMSFFCDIGSYIFISPPISSLQVDRNMFGFGGLYIIKAAELTYHFQRIVDGNVTIPNLESKYTMSGVMVTHGDSLLNDLNVIKKQEASVDPCSIVRQASDAPVDQVSTADTVRQKEVSILSDPLKLFYGPLAWR